MSLLLGPRPPALSALWQTGGRRGVTAAVCTSLPLAAGVALGRPDLGSAAALAAFTSVYGHALPYRRRAVVVAAVGVALTVAGTLGALAGGHPVAVALLCGALAAAAAAATVHWRLATGPLAWSWWRALGARARGDDATVASLARRLPDAAG